LNFAAAAFGYGMDGLPILRAPPSPLALRLAIEGCRSAATQKFAASRAKPSSCGTPSTLRLQHRFLRPCTAWILQCGYFNRNAVPLNGELNFKGEPDKMMLSGKIKCGADCGASRASEGCE